MQNGATNMDSNTVQLETDELLNNGFAIPAEVTEHFQKKVWNRLTDRYKTALAKTGAVIAGGCFLPNVDIKDVDIFFPSVEQANDFLNLVGNPVRAGKSNQTIAYGIDLFFEIIKFHNFNSPMELLSTFDISVAAVGYECATGTYHYSDVAAEDLTYKQFRVLQVNCNLPKQLSRISKYRYKGYAIHDSTWDVIREASKLTDEELDSKMWADYVEVEMPRPVPLEPRLVGPQQIRLGAARAEELIEQAVEQLRMEW